MQVSVTEAAQFSYGINGLNLDWKKMTKIKYIHCLGTSHTAGGGFEFNSNNSLWTIQR